jgi:hypothetical protein
MADNNPTDLGIDGLQQAHEIGIGGFATVYRAFQPSFRRTVAVKVLATPSLDRAARERFERECQAMGTLADHPHIVTIYGSGYTRQGRPYLVMAYLPGGSLQDRVDHHGPVRWQEATLYAVHLAGALETAHRAGIVHRDIKPGNVLLSAYGEAQLTDFGIARISGGHETRSGLITASMAHAPPEVLDGHRPTVTADVYALASTTFELMFGRPAFASPSDESMVPMLRRILTDAPPDLRGQGVPDAVCRALERAMAKSPDQRYASAGDLGRELQAARRALGLDPGRLTVPADVGGRGATLVVAPAPPAAAPSGPAPGSASGPSGPSGSPSAPAPALPPPPAAPAAPRHAGAPAAASARPGVLAAPPEPARRPLPPPPSPGRNRVTRTADVPGRPRFDAPPAVPVKTGSRSVVVGLAAVLVVMALVGVLIMRRGAASAGPPTVSTRSPLPTYTSRPGTNNYDAKVAEQFNFGCVNESFNTPGFCQCLYDAITKQIPYDQFVQINRAIDGGARLEDTPVYDLAYECWKKHPPSPK